MKRNQVTIDDKGKMDTNIFSSRSLKDALNELLKYARKMEEESIKEQNAEDSTKSNDTVD